MQSASWQRLSDLFHAALERSPAERPAFLEAACAGDPALRTEIQKMLEAHEAAADNTQQLLSSLTPVGLPLQPGTLLGPYHLEELLGRGGMGEVWRAVRRDDQFYREVAIKVVRPERATPELVRRFIHERQVLARLDHPGIATLLDGGLTPSGQPYLVMQYVRGVPITRYADEQRLDTAARLRLFRKVCEAVQFAHSHLIVHRDLKPSNILVDAEGRPRLLDFGIAKLLDPAASDSTTGDLMLLTPEHAAPEQFRGQAVTTATDVYALGVLLYELLTGTRPFRDLPPAELSRAVCEREPTPPSAVRTVHPDLDQIVLMALRKDPARRYASASQLGEDVARFLGGYPVIARPDRLGYRMRRFVARNRGGVAAAAVLGVTLLGAVGVTAWQSARRAVALRQAEAERARANRITEFLLGVFRATNPNETRGRTVTARELLDQAVARVRRDLAEEPDARADMELAIGRAYAFIGMVSTADTILARVVATRRSLRAVAPLELADAIEWHARVAMTLGRLTEGIAMMREVIELREAVLGPEAAELAPAHHRIGLASVQLDPYDSSGVVRRHYERALQLYRSADPPDHRSIAEVLRHLAGLHGDLGRPADALALYQEAVATARRAVDDDDPFLFNLYESLALGLQGVGLSDSAIAIHRRLLEARRRVFGPEHMDVSFSLFNLGRDLGRIGRFDEALPLLEACVALRERLVGPDHYQVAYALAALAHQTARSGNREGGARHYQRAIGIAERTLGLTNPTTLEYLEDLALLRLAQGRRQDALATLTTLVSRGYRSLERPEYAPLARDPAFQALARHARQ